MWLKHLIRQNILKKRKGISKVLCERYSLLIAKQISKQKIYQNCQHLALYMAVNQEADPIYLLKDALQRGKQVYIPVICDQTKGQMQFVNITEQTVLQKNKYGILEPKAPYPIKTIPPVALDLAIVPLVAFDAKGRRLGMGGGYYDRIFKYKQLQVNSKPYLIGIAFSIQQVLHIPHYKHDIMLDDVFTEKDRIFARKT